MIPKPCLSCGNPTTHGSRCLPCDTANHEAAYGGQWAAISKRARARVGHCQCRGCSLHPGPCTATRDLTLDHLTPHARGGTVAHGTAVLCRRCNTAKRDRTDAPALTSARRLALRRR